MKILYIHEFFTDSEKNGANVVAFTCYDLTKNEKNNDVHFFATNKKPYINKEIYSKYFPSHYMTNKSFLGNIIYRINCIYNFNAKKNIEKLLSDFSPDIVHIHSVVELSYSILAPIAKRKIPIVMTVHDLGISCPVMGINGPCRKCSKHILNCIKLKCSKNNLFFSFYMAIKFMVNKYLLNKYKISQYIAPSEILLKNIDIDNSKKYCLPNCLDETFNNTTPNYNNKGYFLYVGGLIDIKGVHILLNAISELPKNISFHIVGSGNHEHKYKKYVQDNKLNNVHFVGKKNREELLDEYKNAIAIIVPSNYFETFGMINIEAFANGKPVIASNIGGIPEIVEHNVNGLLFKAGNVEELKQYILKYWNNIDLVIEHGKNAYKKSKKIYSRENYNEKLLNLYNELIRRKNNAK